MEDELLWWQKNSIIFGLLVIGTLLGWIFKDATMFSAFLFLAIITIFVSFIQWIIKRYNTEEEYYKVYDEDANHIMTYSTRVRKKK